MSFLKSSLLKIEKEHTEKNSTLHSLHSSASLQVLACTWNMHGKAPPSYFIDAIEPPSSSSTSSSSGRNHHIYAFGTEEFGSGIASSLMFNASSDKWLSSISEYLGKDFSLVAQVGLGAIHLAIFAHIEVLKVLSDVQTGSVATGFANTIGNKGGVAVSFNVGSTSMLFVNCHLAAHQKFTEKRNEDLRRIEHVMSLSPDGGSQEQFIKINTEKQYTSMMSTSSSSFEGRSTTTLSLEKTLLPSSSSQLEYDEDDEEEQREYISNHKETSSSSSSSSSTIRTTESVYTSSSTTCFSFKNFFLTPNSVSDRYDRVIWMGDLNYRIDLKRDEVDGLLQQYMNKEISTKENEKALQHLRSHDQLNKERLAGRIFSGFAEGVLSFKPTYKLDKESDDYDTSPKRRIPSWTDRILFKSCSSFKEGIILRSYSSIESIKTSDHRPVVAQFDISLLKTRGKTSPNPKEWKHQIPILEAVVSQSSSHSDMKKLKNKKTAKVTPM